jgi:hypothetical protein
MTEQRVVDGAGAGEELCRILKLDQNKVMRILIQAEPGKPLFAHVSLLVDNEEQQEMFTFLEPLERLDPINDTAQGNGLWTPR